MNVFEPFKFPTEIFNKGVFEKPSLGKGSSDKILPKTMSVVRTCSYMCILVLGLVLLSNYAFAQGTAGWVEPATGILDDVLAGGVRIFQAIILIVVLGYCFSSLIQGRFDPMRALVIIVSGALGIGAAEIAGGLFGLT